MRLLQGVPAGRLAWPTTCCQIEWYCGRSAGVYQGVFDLSRILSTRIFGQNLRSAKSTQRNTTHPGALFTPQLEGPVTAIPGSSKFYPHGNLSYVGGARFADRSQFLFDPQPEESARALHLSMERAG